MGKNIHWFDYIKINIFYFGLTTLAQTNGLVFPLLIQTFVGDSGKGTFFGNLRLWSLMFALLFQAGTGILSDHSRSRWGRRRPFIVTGTILNTVFLFAIGFSTELEGMTAYWILFILAILLQASTNVAQGAQQGLIPDLVAKKKRGRFSGVKAVLELPLPLLFVSLTIAKLVSGGNLRGAILMSACILVVVMLITLLVQEKPPPEHSQPLNWKPFLRLVFMTCIFTLIILASGQFVKFIWHLIQNIASTAIIFTVMGISGSGAMVISITLGVLTSIYIGLGENAKSNPAFTWWVINRLAFLAGAFNLSGFALYFIQARLGFVHEKAAQPAANLMLLIGVCILVSAIPSGWIGDKIGHKRLVATSGLIAVAGTSLALLSPNLSYIYLGGSIIGIATGVFYTANWALGTELIPQLEAGRFLGISNLAGAGAGAIGAYIGGPIADNLSTIVPNNPGLGYVLLFSIYGILFLFSVICLLFINNQHPKNNLVTPKSM